MTSSQDFTIFITQLFKHSHILSTLSVYESWTWKNIYLNISNLACKTPLDTQTTNKLAWNWFIFHRKQTKKPHFIVWSIAYCMAFYLNWLLNALNIMLLRKITWHKACFIYFQGMYNNLLLVFFLLGTFYLYLKKYFLATYKEWHLMTGCGVNYKETSRFYLSCF